VAAAATAQFLPIQPRSALRLTTNLPSDGFLPSWATLLQPEAVEEGLFGLRLRHCNSNSLESDKASEEEEGGMQAGGC